VVCAVLMREKHLLKQFSSAMLIYGRFFEFRKFLPPKSNESTLLQ